MSHSQAIRRPPSLLDRPEGWALLLDYDGTLTPIVDRPEDAKLDPSIKALLMEISPWLNNAMAVISGRPLSQLSKFLMPFSPVMFGQHGTEWLDSHGDFHTLPYDADMLAAVRARLLTLCQRYPGLVLEDKGASLALHYRHLDSELCKTSIEFIRQSMEEEAKQLGDYVLQQGKYVFDLHPEGSNKGQCIRQLMGNAPFHGRKPVFIGDDLTDEHGFHAVSELGGIGIKVGIGESTADYYLDNPTALHNWLGRCLAHWRDQSDIAPS